MKLKTWYLFGGSTALLALAVAIVLLWAGSGPETARATDSGPSMNLLVPAGATCDDAADPTKCDVDSGGTITIKIEGAGVDAATIGGFTTLVYLDGLVYTNTGCAGAEVIFTPATIAVCAENATGGVGHGNSGLGAPFASWTNSPDLVLMPDVACPADGAYKVVLTAALPVAPSPNGGSKFKNVDAGDVLLKTSGSQKIEDPTQGSLTVPVADVLMINCGDVVADTETPTPTDTPDADTPTPTATNTPGGPTETPTSTSEPDTPTPTSTATSTPPDRELGDVNCDDVVNSVDSLWVLWLIASIVDDVPCPEVSDVNEDGEVDALDALYILWIELNLV